MTAMDNRIGCPICDAIYTLSPEQARGATRCRQCGYRLTLGRGAAIARVVGVSITNLALMSLVIFMPFLDLRAGTFHNRASVFDAILGFSEGIMVPLSIAVLGFILVLPLSRFLLLIYALGPVLMGWRNFPQAQLALRWSFLLKPWAMAEIFMVGVAVALVKLAGMATISVGPAFWAFAAVVALNVYKDTFMCRNTLWTAIDTNT
ncbi:Inner membrane protein YebS [Actibacterium lipolyticum]|uniref:Inner membrane protein YebS n=2 Tax=Actibacterium lipolyticum TaxID=1524263 RepID=A0A238KR14_9RHOB|nr:Inner membrane protein YebS [Actibacterium lipolyticum]